MFCSSLLADIVHAQPMSVWALAVRALICEVSISFGQLDAVQVTTLSTYSAAAAHLLDLVQACVRLLAMNVSLCRVS